MNKPVRLREWSEIEREVLSPEEIAMIHFRADVVEQIAGARRAAGLPTGGADDCIPEVDALLDALLPIGMTIKLIKTPREIA